MTLQIRFPNAPLSEHVNMLWYWEGYHPPHPKERILPHGAMELIINLCDEPFIMYYPEDGYQPHRFYGPVVAGARSRFFAVDTSQPASILAVYFKPGGAMPFFNASARDLHNLHVPLRDLWGVQADDLYEQLLNAKTVASRFYLLEDALLSRLIRAAPGHGAVDYALTALQTASHMQPVAQVVDQIGISSTRFIQVFREETGLTPKVFQRVKRFQQALNRIAAGEIHDWVDLALSCGYFDQSHFINDFQAFSGLTPTMYFPQSREHPLNLPFGEPS